MSNLSDAQTRMIAKLNSALASKYNIYTKIVSGGYTTPYIVLNGYYGITSPDTTTKSKLIRYHFETLIGIDYNNGCASSGDDNSATIEAELETDIEKIFNLALEVKESEVDISDDMNQDNPTKVSLFTLII